MVYINEATYEMWDFPGVPEGDESLNGWFSVDEVIAPVVQELNQRGYHTIYCCSGHPVRGLLPVYCESSEADGEDEICGYCQTFSVSLYIAFDKDYGFGHFIDIPKGFYMDDENTVIRYDYGLELGYQSLHKRLEACERLFQWTRGLPILAPNRLLNAAN